MKTIPSLFEKFKLKKCLTSHTNIFARNCKFPSIIMKYKYGQKENCLRILDISYLNSMKKKILKIMKSKEIRKMFERNRFRVFTINPLLLP